MLTVVLVAVLTVVVYVGVIASGGPAWAAMPAAVIVAALALILDQVARIRSAR